jgi:hypothetical protein
MPFVAVRHLLDLDSGVIAMDCDQFSCCACKDKLLTRKNASAYFFLVKGISVAPSTLAKYATTGGGPDFVKFGPTVYYQISELDRWLNKKLVRHGCAPRLDSVAPHPTCCKVSDVSTKKSEVEAYLDS